MGIPRATITEGNNYNRDDGKDACTSTARTSAHRQQATTQLVMRWQCVERRRWRITRQRRLEDKRQRRCNKCGIVSCNNQMAKKRSRQRRDAESGFGATTGATQQQAGKQEANRRGSISVQKAMGP